MLATGRPVRYPGEIVAEPASVWLPVGLILLAVLFFRSWLKLLPQAVVRSLWRSKGLCAISICSPCST